MKPSGIERRGWREQSQWQGGQEEETELRVSLSAQNKGGPAR
jgi:hypothetical protein